MDVKNVLASEIESELTDGFKKREAFDIPNGAAHLDQGHIHIFRCLQHFGFDFVGNVRNDLNRAAQKISPAFFLNDGVVNLAGGKVVQAGQLGMGEALVVTEVQVGFRPVLRDKNFAVLEWAHGAGIHIDVRVQFRHADFQPPAFQQSADGSRRNAFAQTGYDATGDENELGPHGPSLP